MAASLSTLVVRRRHAVSREPRLGYEVEVPVGGWPEVEPPTGGDALGAVAAALEWETGVPPGAHVDAIEAVGLVAPSGWERAFVRWLASQLPGALVTGLEDAGGVVAARTAHGRAVVGALEAGRAWDVPGEVPDQVLVRRAATPRGEARAAARQVRAWLGAQGALEGEGAAARCDDVLVLVPSGPEVADLWARELERADLPVRAARFRTLATTGVGAWLLDLAELVGWSETARRPRGALERVFEAPYWSAKAASVALGGLVADAHDGEVDGEEDDENVAGDAPPEPQRVRRADLQWLAREIRRPSISVAEWRRHVEAARDEAARDTADDDGGGDWAERQRASLAMAGRFGVALAGALRGDAGGLCGRFRALVLSSTKGGADDPRLALRNVARARDKTGGGALAERVDRVLRALEGEEERSGGVHNELADAGALLSARFKRLLADRLGRAAIVEGEHSLHGVAVVPYAAYDGRGSDLLVLAGLGEGRFPTAPARPTAREQAWADALGVEAPIAEIDRQIRLAGAAIAGCTGPVTLSYAEAGEGTEIVHPGALLSLLVGGWSEERWPARGRVGNVERVLWSDEIPQALGDATCWREAALFGGTAEAAQLGGATVGAEAERLAGAEARLKTSRAVRSARRPTEAQPSFGPYTGLLPGRGEARDAYSPTSLETYGQCPTQYFLGKILGLEADKEAPEGLDSAETGTAVHAAFAAAAVAVADAARGVLWDLTFVGTGDEAGDKAARAARAADLTRDIEAALTLAHAKASADRPTLSGALMDAVRKRWGLAVNVWLGGHVQPTDDEGRPVQGREEVEAQVAEALASLESLREAQQAAAKPLIQDVWAEHALEPLKAAWARSAQRTYKGANEGDRARVLDEVIDALADLARTGGRASLAKWDASILPRVAHSELSFGCSIDREADPASSPDPVTLDCGARDVRLTGQVDRVDCDPARGAFAVRDYKSGLEVKAAILKEKMLTGQHLQLPLYALAVEALVSAGVLPHLQGAEARRGALDFPKAGTSTEVPLKDVVGVDAEGAEVDWLELGRRWAAHHVDGIEAGRYLLAPTACPLADGRGSHCDFQRVCGFSPAHRGQFPATAGVEVTLPEPEVNGFKKPSEAKPGSSDALHAAVAVPTSDGRGAHARAEDAARDPKLAVVLSAGAGTGKTYNLVRRYRAAIDPDAGVGPQQILCITFTRRAAAEMKQRVRQLLLDPAEREWAGGAFASPGSARKIVLELSAAPIGTLDSLALAIAREAALLAGPGGGILSADVEVVTPAAARALERSLASGAFFDALEAADPALLGLAEVIPVERLRGLLADAAGSGAAQVAGAAVSDEERVRAVLAIWRDVLGGVVAPARACVRGWSATEWDEAYEASLESTSQATRIGEAAEPAIKAARLALDALQHDGERSAEATADALDALLELNTNKKVGGEWYLGKTAFKEWWAARRAELNAAVPALAKLLAAWSPEEATKREAEARVAAAAVGLAAGWHGTLASTLEARGLLRYEDAEALALRALADPALKDALHERFPFKHIFVDESQDTSEGQVELIRRLATLTGATLFWVGDVKQSIYRFRNADVDVFEDLVEQSDGPTAVHALTVNRRSSPVLLRAFNKLFGALLPASDEEERPLDPGSEMNYEPLTWPEGLVDSGKAAVEVVVSFPNKRAEPDEEGEKGEEAAEGGAEDDKAEQDAADDAPEASLAGEVVRGVRDALAAGEPGPDGFRVAILVNSWRSADAYRDALREAGIAAVVQGGRGLLGTPAVEALALWLEAAATRDDVAFAGVLRGPGISVSDAGLFCLRQRWGVVPLEGKEEWLGHKRPRLRSAACWARLDVDAALAAWLEADPQLDQKSARDVLASDAAALDRFRATWETFTGGLGFEPTARLLEAVADGLDLWAFWRPELDGRQAIANLEAFLDLVRQGDADGLTPAGVVRHLAEIRESDDPAAGGLEAGGEARVLITTYWQAKGREWPVVVLPDVHKTRIRRDGRGLSVVRLVRREADGTRVRTWAPAVSLALAAKPFEAKEAPAVKDLLDRAEGPAERAELRRLLYVAMTRAKERVLITTAMQGVAKNPDKRTLASANSWAALLQIALRISEKDGGFDRDPAICGPDEVEVRGPLPYAHERVQPPQVGPATWPDASRWRPVRSLALKEVRPSAQRATTVPEPLVVSPGWPVAGVKREHPFAHESLRGDAFHAVMERWAFGADGGEAEPSADLVRGAIEAQGMAGTSARVDDLLGLVRRAVGGQPELRDRLRAAAERRRLYHEVPLKVWAGEGEWLNGNIDLLYQDEAGWHLLDYKSGFHVPTEATWAGSDGGLKTYYAQVRTYAEGLAGLLPDGELVDFGLWYVEYGLVLRWPAEAPVG